MPCEATRFGGALADFTILAISVRPSAVGVARNPRRPRIGCGHVHFTRV